MKLHDVVPADFIHPLVAEGENVHSLVCPFNLHGSRVV